MALAAQKVEGEYHFSDLCVTVTNNTCDNGTHCDLFPFGAQGTPTPMCHNASGTLEHCKIIYCVQLPYCDTDTEALAANTSYAPTVQVFSAKELVNAMTNRFVTKITLMERILLTDDDVPLVPIAMSRRVLRISAEVSDRVLLYVNVTKTPMFLMDGFSLVEMSNCVILWDLSSQTLAQDISADTHAVLNILPIFSMQGTSVLFLDRSVILVDCSMSKQFSQRFQLFEQFESAFVLSVKDLHPDLDVSNPLDTLTVRAESEMEELSQFWLMPDFQTTIHGGSLTARRWKLSCSQYMNITLWDDGIGQQHVPESAAPILATSPPAPAKFEWALWLGLILVALLMCLCFGVIGWRKQNKAALLAREVSDAQLRQDAMLRTYESAITNSNNSRLNASGDDRELELQWSQVGERIHQSITDKMRSEQQSGIPPTTDEGNCANSDVPADSHSGSMHTAVDQSAILDDEDSDCYLSNMSVESMQSLVVQSKHHSYRILHQAGMGSNAICYHARDVHTGESYALKVAKQSGENESFQHEAQLMSMLKHPHIVSLRESFSWHNRQVIVMSWCSKGDFRAAIDQAKSPLSDDFIWQVSVQLCLALDYLHSHKIAHRDVKLENVFLNDFNDVQLGDFGIARVVEGEAMTFAGTPLCMAPEVLWREPYTHKSDVWSLGTLIYELITLMPLFRAGSLESLKIKHLNLEIEEHMNVLSMECATQVDPDMARMVVAMLNPDMNRRPTPKALLQEPYLQRVLRKLVADKRQIQNRSKDVLPV